MAFIPMQSTSCSHCHRSVDMAIFYLCSGLGPVAVQCHGCQQWVGTERVEWPDMTARGKARFFFITTIYVIFAFVFGGHSATSGLSLLKIGEFNRRWEFNSPAFWTGGASAVILVILIQILRVRTSRARSTGSWQTIDYSFFNYSNFDTNGHSKFIVISMVFPWSAWAISRILHQKPIGLVDALIILAAVIMLGIATYRTFLAVQRLAMEGAAPRPDGSNDLFELITQDFDVDRSLYWNFTLKNLTSEDRFDRLANSLRDLGFFIVQAHHSPSRERYSYSEPNSIANPADPPPGQAEQYSHALLTVFEHRIHSVGTFTRRLAELDRFAKANQLQVCDCTATNDRMADF